MTVSLQGPVTFIVAAGALLGLVVALAAPARGAAPDPRGCTLTADPPFFYAGMVFAPAEIQCAAPQSKLRLRTQLTRDGVAVAENTRDCHRTAGCLNTVGSFTTDVAGDQLWCTTAWGWVGGQSIGAATRCEAEPF
jgi:hypothetical protein